MSPVEHEELKKQVMKLLKKGYIRQSMSPCVVLALLALRKDGTWRMYLHHHAIKKITIKYRFPIPRIGDMFDMLSSTQIFFKIDLQSEYYQIRIQIGDE